MYFYLFDNKIIEKDDNKQDANAHSCWHGYKSFQYVLQRIALYRKQIAQLKKKSDKEFLDKRVFRHFSSNGTHQFSLPSVNHPSVMVGGCWGVSSLCKRTYSEPTPKLL